MRKRIVLIMAIACILLITGCGASNSAEDPAGTDNQMVENTGNNESEMSQETRQIALDIDMADTGETSTIKETEDMTYHYFFI